MVDLLIGFVYATAAAVRRALVLATAGMAGVTALADAGRAHAVRAAVCAASATRWPCGRAAASAVYLVLAMQGWTNRRPRESGLSWHALFALAGRLGRDLVRMDRPARLRPLDRARQHRRLLPALPAGVGAADLAAGTDHAVGDAALVAPVRRRAVPALPDDRSAATTRAWPGARCSTWPSSRSASCSRCPTPRACSCSARWPPSRSPGTAAGGGAASAGALAVLARPVGIALSAGAGLAALPRARRWRRRAYLPLLLLPAAELAFFGYLYWRTGDPLAHFHAQERGWGRGVSVLPVVLVKTIWDIAHRRPPALPGARRVHAALVRALVPRLAAAAAARPST